jgi:hypothetical protein
MHLYIKYLAWDDDDDDEEEEEVINYCKYNVQYNNNKKINI